MILREVINLISKEILLELRNKYALGGILVYVVTTVYVCYMAFSDFSAPSAWNALFWIIMLFAATNAIAKSFLQENNGRQLYIYTLASPQAIILSKVVYNMILMLVISLVCFAIYNLLIPMPQLHINYGLFLLAVLLGSMGFSTVLTMVSAISSKANNSSTLLAILSFPLLIPMILSLVNISMAAIQGLGADHVYNYIVMLIGLNVAIVTLAYILFPYLWKD